KLWERARKEELIIATPVLKQLPDLGPVEPPEAVPPPDGSQEEAAAAAAVILARSSCARPTSPRRAYLLACAERRLLPVPVLTSGLADIAATGVPRGANAGTAAGAAVTSGADAGAAGAAATKLGRAAALAVFATTKAAHKKDPPPAEGAMPHESSDAPAGSQRERKIERLAPRREASAIRDARGTADTTLAGAIAGVHATARGGTGKVAPSAPSSATAEAIAAVGPCPYAGSLVLRHYNLGRA
ncbi:unnamed protein product, partial [Phaeothamnion confervicola]